MAKLILILILVLILILTLILILISRYPATWQDVRVVNPEAAMCFMGTFVVECTCGKHIKYNEKEQNWRP